MQSSFQAWDQLHEFGQIVTISGTDATASSNRSPEGTVSQQGHGQTLAIREEVSSCSQCAGGKE